MRIFCPTIASICFVSIDRLNGSPTVISNRRSSNVLSYGRSPAAASTFVFAPGRSGARGFAALLVAADDKVGFNGGAVGVAPVVAPACSDPQPAIQGKHAAQVANDKATSTA